MDSLVSKVGRARVKAGPLEKNSRANISVIRLLLIGRFFVNRLFFRCRELRPKLIGDGLGDFALNRKLIVKRALITLPPEASARPRIGQLRIPPDTIG